MEIRQQNRMFSEMAGNSFHDLTLTGAGEPSIVNAGDVTPEIFPLLNAKPLAGRTLQPEDGKRGAAPVAVIIENLWRSRFGANPALIGRSINLDMRHFTIVGILPASFRYPDGAARQDVWIPIGQDPVFGPLTLKPGEPVMSGICRLKPGIFIAEAQAEMDMLSTRFAKEFPEDSGVKIRIEPFRQFVVGNVETALLTLLGAVGLVLLIACANIANLLLTRATSRAREIAVRTTLGAGRARIVRQLLSESAVLGLLGGVTGIAFAYWGVQGLSSLLPASLPRVNAIRVDNFVLGFALLLSAIASCAFGLAPALFAANSNLQSSLREGGGRSGESRNRRLARSFLAAGEIAIAMVLLVAAGLLLRSFSRLMSVSPGFDAEHVVKADISLPQFQYSKPQQWTAFSNELLARIQADPGLHDSAVAVPRPIADTCVTLPFDIVGGPASSASAASTRTASYVSISPGYFHVMDIPLLSGRLFDQRDVMSSPRVTIISKALARLYFPNQDPLGHQLNFGFPTGPPAMREIVGVVGDVRDDSLDQDPGPIMYVPFDQAPFWGANVVVRSTLGASSVAATLRQEVHEIDKDLPVTDVAMMPDL